MSYLYNKEDPEESMFEEPAQNWGLENLNLFSLNDQMVYSPIDESVIPDGCDFGERHIGITCHNDAHSERHSITPEADDDTEAIIQRKSRKDCQEEEKVPRQNEISYNRVNLTVCPNENFIRNKESQVTSVNKQDSNSCFESSNEVDPEESCVDENATKGDDEGRRSKYDTRKDVLYKNLFRVVKKYYTNLFKATSSLFQLKHKKERKKATMKCVELFVQEQFVDKDSQAMFQSIPQAELVQYVGRIVVPEFMGKGTCSYTCKRDIELLYECIYKYSLKKAKKLYKSEVIAKIFHYFMKSQDFQNMLDTDTTLSRNKDLYRAMTEEVLQAFAQN